MISGLVPRSFSPGRLLHFIVPSLTTVKFIYRVVLASVSILAGPMSVVQQNRSGGAGDFLGTPLSFGFRGKCFPITTLTKSPRL